MDFIFDSVKGRLTDGLRSRSSWGDILFFSTNAKLIDSVSEAIAGFAQYDEHLTRQTRWDLASDKSALTSQTQFMQYDPHRKIGASGTIRVSTSETFDASYADLSGVDSIVFPKYTVFTDEGGNTKFTSTSTQVLAITDDYIDIEVIQGEPKTFAYIADNDTGYYETISIDGSDIENVLYEVIVNGETWDQITDLNAAGSEDKVYELENKLNFDGINIIFGNNVFGVELAVGASVNFKYLETLGITGNILGAGIINTVESTIYDSNVSPNTVEIFCTNLGNLDGGNDEEDIEDIRTNGINTFQAGDKAVVQKDYKVKLEQTPEILNATVWGAYEQNIDNNVDIWTWISTQENLVYVSAYTTAGEQLSNSQKISVIEFLVEDKPPTDIISFVDVNFIYLAFHIQAFIEDESYVLSSIKSQIITDVSDRYSLSNIDFRQSMYETEWKGFINEIEGIRHHTSYLEIIKYESFSSAYLADINLDLVPIDSNSIKIYLRNSTIVDDPWVLIGVDDGANGFTAEPGYTLTGSSINYSIGEGLLRVNSGISEPYIDYEIKVYYKVDSINLDLNERNQIFKIDEIVDVSAEYIEE